MYDNERTRLKAVAAVCRLITCSVQRINERQKSDCLLQFAICNGAVNLCCPSDVCVRTGDYRYLINEAIYDTISDSDVRNVTEKLNEQWK